MADLDTAPDLMQLIEQLQEQVIELAAIKQAATDYVMTNEVVKPFWSNADTDKVSAAYSYLKSLVYE